MKSTPKPFLLSLLLLVFSAGPIAAQILNVAELNTMQIRSLDRARTVVILPGGILEQHGPYLPSFTDGYVNERMVRAGQDHRLHQRFGATADEGDLPPCGRETEGAGSADTRTGTGDEDGRNR